MNWDLIEGNWKQVKGKVHYHWGVLTDDQIEQIEATREMLAGRIQKIYGQTRDEARRQIQQFNERHHNENWI